MSSNAVEIVTGTPGLLTAVLVTLKVTGHIALPWALVVSPIWIMAMALVAIWTTQWLTERR